MNSSIREFGLRTRAHLQREIRFHGTGDGIFEVAQDSLVVPTFPVDPFHSLVEPCRIAPIFSLGQKLVSLLLQPTAYLGQLGSLFRNKLQSVPFGQEGVVLNL